MMETNNGDARSSNKVLRTQGKNISKLKKFFDSCEKAVSRSVDNPCPTIGTKKASSFACGSSIGTESTLTDGNLKPDLNVIVESKEKIKNIEIATSVKSSAKHEHVSEVKRNVTNINMEHMERTEVENSSSNIPYCRKVSNSSLWENVDIGSENSNQGLWNTALNMSTNDSESQELNLNEHGQVSHSVSELNNLIAVSRAELSKKKEPFLSDKSNLENYFTSFENSKPMQLEPAAILPDPIENFHPNLPSAYNCDMNEINFDEEDAMLSDTSSEEELRCHPAAMNTNYLPAYALHTIIEESCEESERDSRANTPTNTVAASKLERYFSWDIINDSENRPCRKDDDESTIYSDSLSESSGSVPDDSKEVDPSQLASSRLEKYFTSGLLDDQNYFYPEDAEFLDDTPISDFEEESVNQKISRSALLSSLETKPNSDSQGEVLLELISAVQNNDSVPCPVEMQKSDIYRNACADSDVKSELNLNAICDKVELPSFSSESESRDVASTSEIALDSSKSYSVTNETEECSKFLMDEKLESLFEDSSGPVFTVDSSIPLGNKDLQLSETVSTEMLLDDTSKTVVQKKLSNRDQLTFDIQGIIKKLLCYFTEPPTETLKQNIETDYISAWEILETEIELLLQSISPNSGESNSCNSSTIDSNNSDYGSDTIESVDCMTDEDENSDAKKLNAKFPLVDILNSSYNNPFDSDLSTFNISDETLSIWKRLIQSLQKDNFLSKDQICDLNAEARLYIRDQIVTLMHTVTEHDADSSELDKIVDVVPNIKDEVSHTKCLTKDELPVTINESYNEMDLLQHLGESIATELLQEGVSKNCCASMPSCDDKPSAIIRDSDFPKLDKVSELHPDLQSTTNELTTNTQLERKPSLSTSKMCNKDELKFDVIVDISLDDVTELNLEESKCQSADKPEKFCLPHNSITDESSVDKIPIEANIIDIESSSKDKNKHSSCDTGYYSFKSSDDSMLNTSSPSLEAVDVPNFKSLKRTVKKFPLTNSLLSRSTNNIFQAFSFPSDSKCNMLQSKSKKVKSQGDTTLKEFTNLFSPSAVLKRFTGSKVSNEEPNPESSIPTKYLKKYSRSSSVDNEIFGAVSMPQLNAPKPGDSYSALGLYSENDKESSILEDVCTHPAYFRGSQSVLSLGSISASMTSVYSGGGCHYGNVTVTGDVLFGLNYNQKSQMMEVFVKQCRNIAAVDVKHNRSNPYVKVYLLPDKTRSGKRKTKVKKNTLSPVFNELLRFPVQKNELESRTLWLTVWNSDLFGKNDFLGEISLPLGYRLLDSPTLRWYPLQERVESLTSPLVYRGELFLALKYVPKDLSLEPRFRPAPVISLRGALHVLVKEARNIATNRSSGILDAFCKSYLLPDKCKSSKQKTPVVRRSRHPKWYYTVIYEDMSIEELKERSLELTLWDHDKLTSNEFMGAVRLNTGTGLYHGLSVDWMDGRRDECSLWNAMLESPNMWVDGCLALRPTMHFQNT